MNSTLQPNSLPQPQVSLPSLLFFQPSPDFRPLFSIASALFHFPYPVTPLFATLTKTAGCVPTIPKMEHSALPERNLHESANLLLHHSTRRLPLFGIQLPILEFPFSIFHFRTSHACIALLHSRSQRILFLLTEDSDAYRFGREAVHRWNRRRDYFLRCGSRAAIRSKTFLRNALALHRPLPWWPHRRHLRRAAPAEYFLHGRRQWRRLENHGLRQYLESDFRRPAHRLRRRSRRRAIRSEHYLRRQRRRIAAPGPRHRRRNL